MRIRTRYVLLICLGGVFIYSLIAGIAQSPLVIHDAALKVEPAYLTGVLTASGILFGIWAAIIGRGPATEQEKALFPYIGVLFFSCFFLLIGSVIFVVMSALSIFSSAYAIVYCLLSFVMNAYCIFLPLKDWKFRDMFRLIEERCEESKEEPKT